MDILQSSLRGVCFILHRNIYRIAFRIPGVGWGVWGFSALSDAVRRLQEQSLGILETPFCRMFIASSGQWSAALAAGEAQLPEIKDFHTFHL